MTSSTPRKHEPPHRQAPNDISSLAGSHYDLLREMGGVGGAVEGGVTEKPACVQPTVGRPAGEVFCIIAPTPLPLCKALRTGPQTAATFFPSWNTSEDRVSMEVLRNSGVLSSVRTMGWMMRDA